MEGFLTVLSIGLVLIFSFVGYALYKDAIQHLRQLNKEFDERKGNNIER